MFTVFVIASIIAGINALAMKALDDDLRTVAMYVAPLTEEIGKYVALTMGCPIFFIVYFTLTELIQYMVQVAQAETMVKAFATFGGQKFESKMGVVFNLRLLAVAMHLSTMILIICFDVYGMLAGMVIHHLYNKKISTITI
jgi:hypothetical protein